MIKLVSILILAGSLQALLNNQPSYVIQSDFSISYLEEMASSDLFADEDIVAFGSFIDDRNTSGWTYLIVNTSSQQPDYAQTMAAGYMEGYLGYKFVHDTFVNSMIYGEISSDVFEYIANQSLWIQEQIALNPSDNYWQLVNTTWSMYQGLYNGYTDAVLKSGELDKILSPEWFYMITYVEEIGDVEGKLGSGNVDQLPHCSFLLKLAEEDLYVSHTTWSPFQSLLKTYKVYQFNLQNPLVKNNFISYSSQPGAIPSGDDFYILENNKFVAETTLVNSNPDTYEFLHYFSIPYWIRIMLANFAFDTQENWMTMYFTYRSGTYNNQWLVVDFDQYYASKQNLTSAKNIIWIIEEFYAMTSAQDVTQSLLIPQTYVASYNVPYSPLIQYYSQDPTNYTDDPRHYLFAKYAPGIQNLDDFKTVMRLNNISDTGDYCKAIAARCDLAVGAEKKTFGAIDCKVTSAKMITDANAWIILGPTTENLPPFDWANWPQYNASYGRAGMSMVYNNSWHFLNMSQLVA